MPKEVSIIGLGYLGGPLARELHSLSYTVRGTTRTLQKQNTFKDLGIDSELLHPSGVPGKELLSSDSIVLNIPPFDGQLAWFKSWPWNFSKRILFVSSTSVYEADAGEVNEESSLNEGILSSEEEWIRKNFSNSVILRAGGILGPGRHPGKILSGRENLSKPRHPVNLIHVDDLRGVITNLLESEMTGVFNVVSDEHHSRKDFYQEFCSRNALPLPHFDESDESEGKLVSNKKLKSFYQLRWPIIFGKDL